MDLTTVKKTFKLDDEIHLDDGTIIVISKRVKKTIYGDKPLKDFHMIVKRDGEIGKIKVVRPRKEEHGNF